MKRRWNAAFIRDFSFEEKQEKHIKTLLKTCKIFIFNFGFVFVIKNVLLNYFERYWHLGIYEL